MPAEAVEEGGAQIVEADLVRDSRSLGELLVDARQGLRTVVFDLQLDEERTGVAGGEDEKESEWTDHARPGEKGKRVETRGQAVGASACRATLAPSACNFNSIPS
jgi:hypothetical protein